MALTEEQIKELKRQLSQQIQHLPPEQKQQAQEQIDSMSPEALEEMLNQQRERMKGGRESQKGIFRMIVDEEIKSRKIDESKEAIAVLDIRPVSKGHVIIIPKKAVGEVKLMSAGIFGFAKAVAKRMSVKLKAESAEIQTENKFGEAIINVIPVYKEPVSLNSQRYEADEKELDEVYEKLKVIKKQRIPQVKLAKNLGKEAQKENILKLKRRIP